MGRCWFWICLALGIVFGNSSEAINNEIVWMEDRIVTEINQVRESYGLKQLKKWDRLCDCAREHSQNMAVGFVSFGHDGFDNRAHQMQKMGKLSSFAENVAYSYNCKDPVMTAVNGWMKSKGHKKNILGNYEETGVGVSISREGKIYSTQLFAKRR